MHLARYRGARRLQACVLHDNDPWDSAAARRGMPFLWETRRALEAENERDLDHVGLPEVENYSTETR